MVLVFFLLNRKYNMFKIGNRDRQIWKTFKQEISTHRKNRQPRGFKCHIIIYKVFPNNLGRGEVELASQSLD